MFGLFVGFVLGFIAGIVVTIVVLAVADTQDARSESDDL